MKKSRFILIGLLGLFSCTTEDDVCCEDTVVPIEIPAAVVDCEEANALSFVGVDCPFDAPDNSLYTETLEGDLRKIVTNTVPNHIYGDYRSRFAPFSRSFSMPMSPTISTEANLYFKRKQSPSLFLRRSVKWCHFCSCTCNPFYF